MRFLASFVAAFVALASQPSLAQSWHVAETNHFTVYSKDSSKSTEEFARELERLDEALRIISGIGPDRGNLPESAKVTVFRFGETSDMAALIGAPNSGVGGFFIGRASGSVAFVPRTRNVRRERGFQTQISSDVELDPKAVLFHEYVHYFMFQHADAPYPLWYSEGFAELFSNVQFNEDNFIIGEVPSWRSISLATIPVNLEKTFDPPAKSDAEASERVYAHGWLIASHLNLNVERRGQMSKYMRAVAEGKGPMDAARAAFGDLDVLTDELEKFRKGRARLLKVPYLEKTEPKVVVRALDKAEAERMAIMIPAKRGVSEDQADKLAGIARSLAEKYPESAPVMLAATEAVFDARKWDEAEAMAKRTLELDPQSVDAAIYLGLVDLMRSLEDPSKLVDARRKFVEANRMANDHAFPLYGYYLTHLLDETTPVPDIAKAALEDSFRYAPFDPNVRQALVHMLLEEGAASDARILGARWIMGRGGSACMLRKKFERFEAGDRQPLLDEVKPDHPAIFLDKDQRKAEREKSQKEIAEYGCEV